jgi:hypothetical protein
MELRGQGDWQRTLFRKRSAASSGERQFGWQGSLVVANLRAAEQVENVEGSLRKVRKSL